jgi:EAL domain-containing protein (putative c-di-GMP-specific phosphodiesterase class I)/cellulose synthase/poly-beta-1,6-N-acetylglucosamine synthase-like glycosyltransferase
MAITRTTVEQAKRQWGHDRRSEPPSTVPAPISDSQVALARLALVLTVLAWVAYTVSWVFDDLLDPAASGAVARTESVGYLLIVSLLTTSSVAYLLSRLGYMYRSRAHHPATRATLDDFYERATPTLTAIVPSYQEDARVIRKTLLSAALQEYPDVRVVLLIDDPPVPRSRRARELLAAAQAVPRQITELLAEPGARFADALEAFEKRSKRGELVGPDGLRDVAAHYLAAVAWLDSLGEAEEIVDHTDAFFVNDILGRLARQLDSIAEALLLAAEEGALLPHARVRQLYRRLAWTFHAELSSFERKRYVSLSHEPNKAMNLNSYIGLMGGSYRELRSASGTALVPAGPGAADLSVPDPDFVLTLDADSVILPEYCLRLVHLLSQSEQRRAAIAQTPYSAFPGSATRLERIAGGTTDIQHIVHQGLTYYDATFWVGANAVIRKAALDEIATTSYVGDYEIRSYIKDRTVIEDTESTIDLAANGWTLHNYPERLSYSATPPDFGALCIQRRRWANGGLLILPKLRLKRRTQKANGERVRFGDTFLRWNYMASISWGSVSLLVLLVFPFGAALISPLLGLVALPYFLAMAGDLKACGYKRTDIFRVYGFNLLLLPVNLAGTASSLVQAITASRSAFARTPKVRNRTVAPALFVVSPYVMVALAAYTLYDAYRHGRVENMAYAALNVALLLYAIVAFVGIRASFEDIWIHAKTLLYAPEQPRRARRAAQQAPAAAPDWRTVLQLGPGDPGHWPRSAMSPIPRLRSWSDAGFEAHAFRTVFQPVVDLRSDATVGYEALTRFDDGVSAEHRIASEVTAGNASALEGLLARAALSSSTSLPEEAWLAIKVSTRLLGSDAALSRELERSERPVVLEITEPTTTDPGLELQRLRADPSPGIRLAIDRAGTGHKTLSLLAEIRPDFLKLDRASLLGITADRALQIQVASVVRLADEYGCLVIASGIEDDAQLAVLRSCGVHCGQGYLLGRPGELVGA